MARSPAERQAAYRQRHLQDVDGNKARLNILLEHPVKLALVRLAKRNGVTQSALLERLLLEEQNRVLASMSDKEQDAYYDSVPS